MPYIDNPYVAASFTGVQRYYFDDNVTMETRVVLMGPFSIIRKIQLTGVGWYYVITKDGDSNAVALP